VVTPARAALLERAMQALGGVAMAGAAAAVDWRVGLFLAGLLLTLSAVDLRVGRRT
jgi:hypothetical protein